MVRLPGQVEAELHAVSTSFARLHGRGELALDLYGRGTAPAAAADQQGEQQGRDLAAIQSKSRLRCVRGVYP